ncbi:Gfo/Idh/MocA family protein [Alloyangia pacifica]|uniref:Predicted dehydrogenase n=1 Tax=Alloyangia pacifica TaxID=311180 RepID=A0A1I6W5P9_9RHOB|nr:Gfo/Idh/MocA family oxidoreductase [Alloyangia pacifica]SDI67872.1 Predicted dehydrogenase [Alloyangia pacifica]SFT21290.1 Predicted dehydrogenase [Alloyangia pacifica]
MKDLSWGILGTAGIARKAMLPALRDAEGCRLGAIASRDVARAEAMAGAFGIPRAYGSYEALLADPEIEVIYNPLPNHLHVPLTLQALAAGKHVLCEKPLALTLAEAREVTTAAQAAGRVVAEAFMTRHHPQWIKARELVSAGRIGRLTGVQALFSYCNDDPQNVRNQKDIGGGGLYDVGCYAVDTARFFFGAEPEAVSCTMDLDPKFGTDRLTTGTARFPGGGQLSFTVSTQSALVQQLTLLGTEGYLVLDAPFNCPPDHPARLALDNGADLLGGGRELLTCPPADQYRLQAESFARAVHQGGFAADAAADTLGNAAALEALTRAAQSHRWEAITSTTGQAGD